MKRILVSTPLVAAFAIALWWVATGWPGGELFLSGPELAPVVLGLLFATLIGGGLMALLLISSRLGRDEAVYRTLHWAGPPTSADAPSGPARTPHAAAPSDSSNRTGDMTARRPLPRERTMSWREREARAVSARG